MKNLEIGDIVNIRIVDNLQIVVTNIKDDASLPAANKM